jgi:hypothetical protein
MTKTVQATFDGKVFVPDDPVDLIVGQRVLIDLPVNQESPLPFKQLVEKWSKEPIDSDLPADYAAQIDHYLYGTPKRKL